MFFSRVRSLIEHLLWHHVARSQLFRQKGKDFDFRDASLFHAHLVFNTKTSVFLSMHKYDLDSNSLMNTQCIFLVYDSLEIFFPFWLFALVAC